MVNQGKTLPTSFS